MEWTKFLEIKKFTHIDNVFKSIGNPMFRLGTRPIYYIRDGFLISYSPTKFRIENNKRIEYGEQGEYALSLYYFSNKQNLEEYFKLNQEKYEFEADIFDNSFEIVEGIQTISTNEQVINLFKHKSTNIFYQEGETRTMTNGKFEFQNNFVKWGSFTFLFFGKSKKTKMSGFEFMF